MNEQMTEKERMLWKQAKKRVDFKRHLWTYIIINGFLWALWLFTGMETEKGEYVPWPVWSTFGWGIGLAFNYFNAYHANRADAVEKEYQKMKQGE
jgi:hypothetical protein